MWKAILDTRVLIADDLAAAPAPLVLAQVQCYTSPTRVLGTWQLKDAVKRREFGDGGWECPHILAALDGVDDLYFDVVSQIRLDRWSRGRTALAGDAAACVSLMAGEGTGLAMTEAYVLAGELVCARGDYRRAFDAYDTRLRRFVEHRQAAAQKYLPVFATQTRLGIRFRNLVMTTINFRPLAYLLLTRSVRDDFE